MLQQLNEYAVVDLIDNTNVDGFQGYAQGFSENHNLLDPSEAQIISSPKHEPGINVQFINYQSWEHDGHHIIPNDSIFLSEGSLARKGLILKKTYVEQIDSGFKHREQDFFQVVASNLDGINQGDFIVTKSYTSFRFNFNKSEYFYASKSNILIVINEEGVKPGPAYVLIKNDSKLLYQYAVFSVNINNEELKVVPKTAIYGESIS